MSVGVSDSCDRPDEDPAGRRWRRFANRSVPFRHASRGVRATGALVWLAFIVFPLVNAIGKHGTVLQQGGIIASASVFVAAYATMVLTWRLESPTRITLALFLVLLSVATVLTLAQSSDWGFLFTYCAACTALVARKQLGFSAVTLCVVLAAVTSTLGGANGGTVISFVASTAGVGMLMLVLGDLRLRNEELSQARAELAEMAVARERERFARDLHDLLGHSLSVITLKAELAGRMLSDRPEEAAREVADLEQVARTALSEVREAVSGYRQPTLEGELGGARMALSAAGIAADVEESHVRLEPTVEAVLAWAVREGATNVIRHSGARHCTLRVNASLTDAGVEVTDDGAGKANGAAGGIPSGGHGLAGLAERARLVNGTLEAGILPSGGYRLAVTVPVSRP